MKHYIISKFKLEITKEQINDFIPDIEQLFNKALEIEGISDVQIVQNCINRPNRYDLMIILTMKKESLEVYDKSVFHKQWKEKYGNMLESKAIFDSEQ